jgi:integrase/recombinase XerD
MFKFYPPTPISRRNMKERTRVKGKFIHTTPSYQPLLSYSEVKRWIDLYRAPNTRSHYLRVLESVTKFSGLTPTQLIKLSEKEAHETVMSVVRKYIQEDNTSWALIIQAAMKGFYEANDKTLTFTRRDRVKKVLKKVVTEHIPTKEEIYRMVDSEGSLRNKAILLCLYQSGVRISCLCRWSMSLLSSQLSEGRVPIRLKITNKIDTKLSGYGLPYYVTFLGEEATKSLREYLNTRGKLSPNDPVFATVNSDATRPNVDKHSIWRVVKRAAKNIGLDPQTVWPHTLRKAFRKALYQGGLDNDMAEAIMGHKLPGSKSNYFDFHDVEEIEANYKKANFSRVTVQVSEEAMKEIERQQLRRQVQKVFGFDPEEILKPKIAKMNRNLTIDEEIDTLTEKVKELWGMRGSSIQKVIGKKELEKYLNRGWNYKSHLNNGSGKVIVER